MLLLLILLIYFMELKDFQNPQSMTESAQILMASAVILRMAFGQIASCNALCGNKVLSESDSKKLVSSYKHFMGVIEKCHSAYVKQAEYLNKQVKAS